MLNRGPLLHPLRRKTRQQDWRAVITRTAIALGLVALVFGVLYIDRDGLKDHHDGHVGFRDVLYFTMITISTVGYGDIVPVSERARLIDAFLITPIRLFVWLIFLGTAFDFLFRRTWERWRMRNIQKKLCDHIILAGFGHSGQKALEELLARDWPIEKVVVIDNNEAALSIAEEAGAATILGDATRDEILAAVHVERATSLIVSPGRDDTAVLIVLTARNLAPAVRIAVGVRNVDNEDLARQAGADIVVNPVTFAGLLLASASHGQHVADYLTDLITMEGKVALQEREARPEEIGRPLKDVCKGLPVRIYRGGEAHSPWDNEAKKILKGDLILEIIPTRTLAH